METTEQTINLIDVADKLLQIYVGDDYERPILTVPSYVNDKFVIATNAHDGILLSKKYCAGDYSKNEVLKTFFNAIPIDAETGRPKETNSSFILTRDMLLNAFDKVPTVPEYEWCDACTGEGEVTCDTCHYSHDCEDCNSSGKIYSGTGAMIMDEEKRIVVNGVMFGIPVLKRLLSTMQILGAESCIYSLTKEQGCNFFNFGEILIYAMPILKSDENKVAYTIE